MMSSGLYYLHLEARIFFLTESLKYRMDVFNLKVVFGIQTGRI